MVAAADVLAQIDCEGASRRHEGKVEAMTATAHATTETPTGSHNAASAAATTRISAWLARST